MRFFNNMWHLANQCTKILIYCLHISLPTIYYDKICLINNINIKSVQNGRAENYLDLVRLSLQNFEIFGNILQWMSITRKINRPWNVSLFILCVSKAHVKKNKKQKTNKTCIDWRLFCKCEESYEYNEHHAFSARLNAKLLFFLINHLHLVSCWLQRDSILNPQSYVANK